MFFNRERMLGGAVGAYESRPFLSKPIESNLQMEAKRTPQCCYNVLQVWYRQYAIYSKIEDSYSGWIAYASAIQPLSTLPTLLTPSRLQSRENIALERIVQVNQHNQKTIVTKPILRLLAPPNGLTRGRSGHPRPRPFHERVASRRKATWSAVAAVSHGKLRTVSSIRKSN